MPELLSILLVPFCIPEKDTRLPYRHFVDEHHHYLKNNYTANEISFSAAETAEPFPKRNGKNKWKPRGVRWKKRKVHHI